MPIPAAWHCGWLDQQAARALLKSPLGQAIACSLNNWSALCRYPELGYLAIDNNLSEHTLRPACLARKNCLFVGNDEGGRTAAVMFTMMPGDRRAVNELVTEQLA